MTNDKKHLNTLRKHRQCLGHRKTVLRKRDNVLAETVLTVLENMDRDKAGYAGDEKSLDIRQATQTVWHVRVQEHVILRIQEKMTVVAIRGWVGGIPLSLLVIASLVLQRPNAVRAQGSRKSDCRMIGLHFHARVPFTADTARMGRPFGRRGSCLLKLLVASTELASGGIGSQHGSCCLQGVTQRQQSIVPL